MNSASYKTYITGFILSITLTLIAYFLVVDRLLSEMNLTNTVLLLALLQFLVQIYFFLHIGSEKGPRWNLAVLASTLSIIFIVIGGSLWIMHHLNYNMMPSEMDSFILHDEGRTP